jgi:galactoside O-acetyltransferase
MNKILNKFFVLLKYIYGVLMKTQIRSVGNMFYPGYFLQIKGGQNIEIGSNFSSNGNVRLYADNGKIVIGNNNSFNSNVFIGGSGSEIHIGNNVLIGPNCVLRSSDHKFSKNEIIKNQGHIPGKIIIEDDVWLGANVVVLKDVIIKKGSVIGAGSVVTKSTEMYSINAGVPAKKITERK